MPCCSPLTSRHRNHKGIFWSSPLRGLCHSVPGSRSWLHAPPDLRTSRSETAYNSTMKILPIFTLFGFLALCCCFLGVASKGPGEDECDQYQEPAKGQAPLCPLDYRPICGSDGVTYPNKCLFCAAKKKSGGKLKIKHEGPCEQQDECSQFPEPAKGQAVACTLEYRPICGSDGVTYGNKCEFCAAKRKSGGKLKIKHEGQCEQKDECGQYPEPAKGQLPLCPRIYKPVCGSDGVTYTNKCLFCAANRKSGGKLTIKHEGPCDQQQSN